MEKVLARVRSKVVEQLSKPKALFSGGIALLAAIILVIWGSTALASPSEFSLTKQSENEASKQTVEETAIEESLNSQEEPSSSGAAPIGRAADSEPEPREIFVHVGGSVQAPGLYGIPEGSRVEAAIAAAGGLSDDANGDGINRARLLADGEQIIVPSLSDPIAYEQPGSQEGGAVGSPSSSALVNINSASAAELEALPGIGPATAQKIVDERSAHGPFSSIDDLSRVSGIGEKKIEALRDQATL